MRNGTPALYKHWFRLNWQQKWEGRSDAGRSHQVSNPVIVLFAVERIHVDD